MALKTNYKDDGFTGNRKYRQVTNADGTLSFEDVTPYNPVGDSFGAKDINDTNTAINAIQTPDFEDYESGASVPDAETALTAIKKKADVSTLLKNIKAALKGAFLKKYILTTMEQVMANTLAGRTADARLLKEVNQNLGGNRFGYTADGRPGWKDGADTVHPFKAKPTSIVVSSESRNGYTNNFNLSSIPDYSKLTLWENMFPVAMHLGAAANTGAYIITGNFSYTYNSDTGVLSIIFIQDNAASYRGIDKITLYYF